MFWRHCMTPLHQHWMNPVHPINVLRWKPFSLSHRPLWAFHQLHVKKTSTFILGSNCKCEQTSVKVRTVCVCVCESSKPAAVWPANCPSLSSSSSYTHSLSLHFLPHTLHLSRPPPLFSASSSSQKDGQTLQMDEKMKHQITQTLPPPPPVILSGPPVGGVFMSSDVAFCIFFLDWLFVDDPLISTF